MKRITLFLLGFIMTLNLVSRADEGMWLLPLIEKLNIKEMQEMGFQLTAEDIYSINSSSLKDAIVIFGRGCTGEIISDQGLILTNHHCGYGAIQQHSSVEYDYLKDGFWAMSKEEEIPTPGLSVTFLKYIEDVTNKIVKELNDEMTEKERMKKVKELSRAISKEATKDNNYTGRVQSFFDGNKYYLLVYEKYTDVRMVGAPPSSIGKYGGDTDNWMWPRHTGDFSLFRVYSAPDGSPAEYSENNVPLKPKHHLPVSIKGIENGDFTMILGYPGGTDRYMTSWGVQEAMDVTNTIRYEVRTVKQDQMLEDMLKSDKVRIQYASKFSRSSNYWKFSLGQNKGLKNLNVIAKKQDIEKEFTKWLASDKKAQKNYGEALNLIENAYTSRKESAIGRTYMSESFYRGSEIITVADITDDLLDLLKAESIDQEAIDKEIEDIKKYAKKFYKDFNAPTDQKVLAALFNHYGKTVDPKFLPDVYTTINEKFDGCAHKFAENVLKNSVFVSEESLNNFLANPLVETIENDPAYITLKSIDTKYDEVNAEYKEYSSQLMKGNRLFVAGLQELNKDKRFYPDANFTMRMTYGQVGDYYPRDAVYYNYYTTLDGVIEKKDPKNFEFEVPERLEELYLKKDYGRYGEEGKLKVCFISNNDITGGNSGSPVINGKGELIGLVFDGNWEAMSGDIAFEPDLQRTISVDIRYVLWVVDKYAGATNLIEEMTIVE